MTDEIPDFSTRPRRGFWTDEELHLMQAISQLDRLPAHFRAAEATNPRVLKWMAALSLQSLLLFGPVGSGKTHQAVGVLRNLVRSGRVWNWQFVNSGDLYAELRPRSGVDAEEVFRRYARSGVLVIDDFGSGKQSEWTDEINYRLINNRYERDLPIIITSNLAPEQFDAVLGERCASRLGEMARMVILQDDDRRGS